MSDYVPKTKDFTNAPLCLSGHGVTKVFGLGEKKTVAVDHVDFDFHEGEFVSIVGVLVFQHRFGKVTHLICRYPALAISNSFQTSHFQTLTFFNDFYISRSFCQ